MIISSYGLALSTAVCIEFPGSTVISAADPINEINNKRKIVIGNMSNLFLIYNSSIHLRNLGVISVFWMN
jgi:hypothetical protein